MIRKGVVFSAVCFAFLLTSCATTSSQQSASVAVQKKSVEEILGENVPIFPGFSMQTEKSFIYESGNIKVGRVVFTGKAKVKDIVSFYKDSLPQMGWEPVVVTIYGNQAKMVFITPDQTLQIDIVKGFSETTLIVQLGPRGELTIPKE